MIVISVSKRWYHPRSEVRQHGKNGAKKRWFVFYLDDEWKLHTKRIHWYEVWWFKLQKKHKRQFICLKCGQVWIAFVRNEIEIDCPDCD